MAAPAVVEVVVQKTSSDCALASLAMLLGKPYRQISDAALVVCPRPHKSGLWTTEIIKVAKKLGATLKREDPKTFDEEGTGLLIVRKRNGTSHVVLLFQGIVIDPSSGLVYDKDTYLKSSHYSVRGVLTI